jgi:hypothetical protein
MHSSLLRRTLAPVFLALAGVLFALAPASAIDGKTAVAICIDSTASGAQCLWSVNDKGEIDICNKSGCVYCPSESGECTAAKQRARPTRTLPVGTMVKTPFGSIETTKDAFRGPIIAGAFCPSGLVRCMNRCIQRNQACDIPK